MVSHTERYQLLATIQSLVKGDLKSDLDLFWCVRGSGFAWLTLTKEPGGLGKILAALFPNNIVVLTRNYVISHCTDIVTCSGTLCTPVCEAYSREQEPNHFILHEFKKPDVCFCVEEILEGHNS